MAADVLPRRTAMLFRFGLFALDPAHRHISYAGRLLQLPPKVFAVLLCLVKHPERIVTKEELREAVWPGVNVGEANLTQTIFLLRHQLQACDPQNHIATIPHRGYQLTMDVQEEGPSLGHGNSAGGDAANYPEQPGFVRCVHKFLSMRTSRSLSAAIRWCERALRHGPGNVY